MQAIQRRPASSKTPPTFKFIQQKNITVASGGKVIRVAPLKPGIPLKDNVIQWRLEPLRKDRRFYTMKVLDIDTIQYIMMGVSQFCWPMTPTWDISRSLRYHSNDGGIFNGVNNMRSNITYTKGDVITCQALHLGRSRCLVEFHKNGTVVFQQWVHVSDSQLYPTLGFSNTTSTLEVDWPLHPAPMVPVALSDLSSWLGLEVIQRGQGSGVVEMVKEITGESGALSLVGPRPFDHKFSYFEIEVLELNGENGAIGVGVVPPVFSRNSLPGWTDDSVGCHSDSGGLFYGNKKGNAVENTPWQKGDVIGCGVHFSDVIAADDVTESVMVTVYFTRNGSLTHEHPHRLAPGGVFPCVGFYKNNHSIKVNTQADSQSYKRALQGALSGLNVAEDVVCSDNVSLTGTQPWLRSVEVTSSARAVVQLTTWPMLTETQKFAVLPLVVPEKKDSYQIEVGVAGKMTSSKEEMTWLCSYNLTSGCISTEGTRKTNMTEYNMKEGPMMCMVDFTHQNHVIILFYTLKRTLGRAVFKRPPDGPPACATVTVTGACGAKLEVHWTGVLFPTAYRDLSCPVLGNWLAGDQTLVTPVKDTAYQGSETTIQAPSFFATGFHYFEMSVAGMNKKLAQLPTLGVCAAWSDLQSLIGSQGSELSLDLTTGEVITNNEIVEHLAPRPPSEVNSVGMGVLFTQGEIRAPQDIVVYFTINNLPCFQRVFSSPLGGTYATLTFPSDGCVISVTPGVHPSLAFSTCVAWLQNISANKARQDSHHQSAGTFTTLATRAFSTPQTQNNPTPTTPTHTPASSANQTSPTTNQTSPTTNQTSATNQTSMTRTDPTIVIRRKIKFDSAKGEAIVEDVVGESVVEKLVYTKEKREIGGGEEEELTKPSSGGKEGKVDEPSTSGAPVTGLNSSDDESRASETKVEGGSLSSKPGEKSTEQSSEKREEGSPTKGGSTAGEKRAGEKGDTPLPKTDGTDSGLQLTGRGDDSTKGRGDDSTKENKDASTNLILPASPSVRPSSPALISDKISSLRDKPKVVVDMDEMEEGLLLTHQSRNVGSNVHGMIPAQEKDRETSETAAPKPETSASQPRQKESEISSTQKQVSRSETLPEQRTESTAESTNGNQSEKESQGPYPLGSTGARASQSSLSIPTSSSSSSLAAEAGVSRLDTGGGEGLGMGEGGDSDSDSDGHDVHVLDSLQATPLDNLLLDPRVVFEEDSRRNADRIQALSEQEAKEVLLAINDKMSPHKMRTYLSGIEGGASKTSTITTQSTSSVTSPSPLRRQNTPNKGSKACILS